MAAATRAEQVGSGTCVYIDARPLWCRRFTGIARYTARLALALAEITPVRFFIDDDEAIVPAGLNWSQDQDLAAWARRVVRSRRRRLGDAAQGVGLYTAARPAERRFPFEVSVLHDFSPLLLPETHTEAIRREYQEFFAKTILLADLVLADSHCTRADAAWLSPVDRRRIVVAPCGPSLCIHEHLHREPIRRRQDVGLVVSALEPRKNPEFLLDWFASTSALPDDAELWWVGPKGWWRRPKQVVQKSKRRRVRFLGAVSDAKLCGLYQHVGWSIYPSLYEGFGFPVLDALRHGVPVLASGNSAIREFESPGLALFDPADAASVDQAWRTLQQRRPITIPKAPLDESYCWKRVAQLILDHHARWQADVAPPAARAA